MWGRMEYSGLRGGSGWKKCSSEAATEASVSFLAPPWPCPCAREHHHLGCLHGLPQWMVGRQRHISVGPELPLKYEFPAGVQIHASPRLATGLIHVNQPTLNATTSTLKLRADLGVTAQLILRRTCLSCTGVCNALSWQEHNPVVLVCRGGGLGTLSSPSHQTL